jgi:hypothetical protein
MSECPVDVVADSPLPDEANVGPQFEFVGDGELSDEVLETLADLLLELADTETKT